MAKPKRTGSDALGDAAEAPNANPGRFRYEGLDRILHEQARLSIMASLITNPNGLAFGDLRKLCDLTDGNLSRHLDVLQSAGLIEIQKEFRDRKPHTACKLTPLGSERFQLYIAELARVIKDALPHMPSQSQKALNLPFDLPPGFVTV